MKFVAGDQVRVIRAASEFLGAVGKVYSVNSHVTAPYPYGVKLYLTGGRVDYKPFADDELEPLAVDPYEEPRSAVDGPAHYTWLPNGIEVIDLTEHLNFNRGNAVKYVARAGRKDPSRELEDLEKARWYIEREIGRLKGRADAC